MKTITSFMIMLVYASCLGCCSCPDVRCLVGAWIRVTPLDDTVFPEDEDYTVKWRTDNESGEVGSSDYFQFSYEQDELTFNLPLLTPSVATIEIEFFYNDEQIGETKTYPLDWEDHFCKSCGEAAWCEKVYVSRAYVDITLDEALE